MAESEKPRVRSISGAAASAVPAPHSEPRFLSVHQVADYLQLNEKKVYALAAEGKLPGTKVTGKWLFPRDLVDQWLVQSSHGGVLTDRLVIAGSDDPLLARVVGNLAASIDGRALLSYTATGTRLGLELLDNGRAEACALHWGPDDESHLRHPALISRFSQHQQWVLVRAFRREQGLIVGRGLETDGAGVADLARGRGRWVLRQEGAGSQRFLQEALARHGVEIDESRVIGRVNSEREAASTIARGRADVAPGVRAAAVEMGLGFVHVGWEAFDFSLHRAVYFRTLFQRLLDEIKSAPTRELADELEGYDLRDVGKLVWASQA